MFSESESDAMADETLEVDDFLGSVFCHYVVYLPLFFYSLLELLTIQARNNFTTNHNLPNV